MFGRTVAKFGMYWLASLLALSSLALAGGFQISVETAPASTDPQLKDAVLIVRTFGCWQPADASLSATAEGIVNGKRESLPVKLEAASTGIYAIKKQWPDDGVWLLAVNGSYNKIDSSAIVALTPDNKARLDSRDVKHSLRVQIVPRKLTAGEIDAALNSLAENAGLPLPSNLSASATQARPVAWMIAGFGAVASILGFVAFKRWARYKTSTDAE